MYRNYRNRVIVLISDFMQMGAIMLVINLILCQSRDQLKEKTETKRNSSVQSKRIKMCLQIWMHKDISFILSYKTLANYKKKNSDITVVLKRRGPRNITSTLRSHTILQDRRSK
ncbi:hypothetical protein BD560DRAFT_487922, partial [Blakeslea trispora]